MSERTGAISGEKWRSFLSRREKMKHMRYDKPCEAAGWSFMAMAFGTWGGMGPEAFKITHRALKRAAGWLEGDLRAARQEELRLNLGLTLMRQVWELLEAKNLV